MSVADYMPVLVQIALAVFFAVMIVVLSQLLGQKAKGNPIKDSAYECGLPSDGKPGARFSVKFYVTAMLFILFDIEIVFLIPLAVVYRDFLANHLPIYWPMMAFVGVLVVGLVYEIRRGALAWDQ